MIFSLEIEKCVDIGREGCRVTISQSKGEVQEIQIEAVKFAENAVRYPCFNHNLNLSLSKLSQIQAVWNGTKTIQEVVHFSLLLHTETKC